MNTLAIYPHLQTIREAIQLHEKLIILAPTGVGKSIGIPADIVNINPSNRIYIAVPSLNVAKSIIYSQSILNPTLQCGYATESFQPEPGDRIVYATSSYIKDIMLNNYKNKQLGFTPILFVDEAHINGVDNYLIVKLWESYRKTEGAIVPRLVLMSSVINEELYPDFHILRVNVSSKNMVLEYSQNDFGIRDQRRYDAIVNKVIEKHLNIGYGHFIVFAPGRLEVLKLATLIDEGLKKLIKSDYIIIKSYGGAPRQEFAAMYGQTPIGIRKIIVTTNINESTVTIADIVGVFDIMLEKRIDDSEKGRLQTVFISKASAIQRTGRGGRTIAGYCYRMCTQATYNTLLEFKPSEIEKTPLYGIILNLAHVGINPLEMLPRSVRQKIKSSIQLLRQLEMVNSNSEITDLGIFYYRIGLNIRTSAILWWWLQSTMDIGNYPGLLISIIINNFQDNYFSFESLGLTRDKKMTKSERDLEIINHKNKYWGTFAARNDLQVYLKMWLSLTDYLKNTTFANREKIKEWCELYSINEKKIYDVIKTLDTVIDTLSSKFGIQIIINDFVAETAVNRCKQILRKVYKNSELVVSKDGYNMTYRSKSSDTRWYLRSTESVNTLSSVYAPYILSIFDIETTRGNIITFAIDITDEEYNSNFIVDIIKNGEFQLHIPYRSHKPGFISKLEFIPTEYPPLNLTEIMKAPVYVPREPLQLYIIIGKKLPFNQYKRD